MKKLTLVVLTLLSISACKPKNEIDEAASEIDLHVHINRFDQDFFSSDPDQLPNLKKRYPFFFPPGNADHVWTEKMKNPLWRELFETTQKVFGDFKKQQDELDAFFKRIKYLFPAIQTPEVYTIVGDMDYQLKTVYAHDKLIIPLELYLGENSKFYQNEFPKYIRQNFKPSQLMPDVAEQFASKMVAYPSDKTFLAGIIYQGKIQYLKEMLLPDATKSDIIGYQNKDIEWCKENERYIWQYFVEKGLLYKTDAQLANRFTNPAPFSKFYLAEIDNESPGRVGVWIGWQIVSSYMKNNDTKLTDLLKKPAVEIFEKSQYKPKKND